MFLKFKLQLKLTGTSGGVMVNKLDKQTFTNEFDSHWMSHSYGFVI